MLAAAARVRAALPAAGGVTPAARAADEAYWREVSTLWAPSPEFINLEYGYFHAAALPTLEAELRMARRINTRNSHYKRNGAPADREAAREALAATVGAEPEEIAVVRNATEALDTVILGLDVAAGDEIVHGDQDYGSMMEALKQKAARHGVVLRGAVVPLHPVHDEEVVAAYAAAMTPRTRLLHVTSPINITGHVLPVAKICAMAHAAGAEVIVDAAHGIGLLDTPVRDLGCDYLGTSLHKWMASPLGLGMLYVRRDKIEKVWPLMGDVSRDRGDIRKLERLGTRPESAHVGLLEAIRLHEEIGPAHKLARMRFLHARWSEALREVPGVVVNSPLDATRYAAVGNVGLAGVPPRELADYLWGKHQVFVVGIGHPRVPGVRVTPGVPSLTEQVDRFVGAMHAARKHFG